MRRRRSTNSKLDYKGKEKYKRKKDMIHKRREKEKPEQRGDK
jgi:hypothetical protein